MSDPTVRIRLKDEFSAGMRRIAGSTRDFKRDFESSMQASAKLAANLSLIAGGIDHFGGRMRVLAESMTGPAISFEETMAKVQGIMKPTADEMEKLRELTASFDQQGPNAMASALLEMGKDGKSAAEAMQGLGAAVNVAVGTGNAENISEVADQLGNIKASFSDTEAFVGDVMAKLTNTSAAGFGEFAEAMREAGPAAASAHQSLTTTATALGLLADRGKRGALAGTNLKMVYDKLNPSGKAQKKLWEDLGVSVDDGTGKFRDAGEVLADLHDKLAPLTETARDQKLQELFGADAKGSAQILIEAAGGRSWKDLKNKLEDADGAAKDLARATETSAAAGIRRMKADIEKLQLEIGTQMLPVLKQLLDDLKPLITEFGKWAKENPETVKQIGELVIASAALAPILSTVASGMATISAAAGPIHAVLTALGVGVGGAGAGAGGAVTAAVAIPAAGAAYAWYEGDQAGDRANEAQGRVEKAQGEKIRQTTFGLKQGLSVSPEMRDFAAKWSAPQNAERLQKAPQEVKDMVQAYRERVTKDEARKAELAKLKVEVAVRDDRKKPTVTVTSDGDMDVHTGASGADGF